jgi:hypothetical protein
MLVQKAHSPHGAPTLKCLPPAGIQPTARFRGGPSNRAREGEEPEERMAPCFERTGFSLSLWHPGRSPSLAAHLLKGPAKAGSSGAPGRPAVKIIDSALEKLECIA